MNLLDIYCVTNKHVNFLKNTNYKIGWVGQEEPLSNYITCNKKDNIFYKEKYYSELIFHYWYWKNLMKLNENKWIGFCQKRRFWIKPDSPFRFLIVLIFSLFLSWHCVPACSTERLYF